MITGIYEYIKIELTPSEKLVFLTLCMRATPEGKAWPSISQLMEDTCLARSTLYKTLDLLEEENIIQTSREKRKRIYTINVHEVDKRVHQIDTKVHQMDKKVHEMDSYIEEDTMKKTLKENEEIPTASDSIEILHKGKTNSEGKMDVKSVLKNIAQDEDDVIADEVLRYIVAEDGEGTDIPTKASFRRFVRKMLKKYRYPNVMSPISLTAAEMKYAENFREYAGDQAAYVLIKVFSNWSGFGSWLEANTNAFDVPHKPDLKYFQLYRNEVMEFAAAKLNKRKPKSGDGEPKVIW